MAKQKGHLFSAYQIYDHYARYLLASQPYYRKEDDFDIFVLYLEKIISIKVPLVHETNLFGKEFYLSVVVIQHGIGGVGHYY